MGNGGSEGLELELLHLLSFSITNGFDNGIEVLLVLRRDVDWLLIRVLMAWTSNWITDSQVSRGCVALILSSVALALFVLFVHLISAIKDLLDALICQHQVFTWPL